MNQDSFELQVHEFQVKVFQRIKVQKRRNAWRAFLKLIELQQQKFLTPKEFQVPPSNFDIDFAVATAIFRELYLLMDQETQRLNGRDYATLTFHEIESTMLHKTMTESVDHTQIYIVREFWPEYIKAREQMTLCPNQLVCPKCGTEQDFCRQAASCQNCQAEYHVHADDQGCMVTSLSPDVCPMHHFHHAHGLRGRYHKPGSQ